MKERRIFTLTPTDHDEIISDFEKLIESGNSYAAILREQIKFENYFSELFTNHEENLKKLNGCEVLIIEDDIKHVIKYFNILEKAKEVDSVYVCTKKKVAEEVFKHLKRNQNLAKTKLIILDFDLNETVDQNLKHKEALDLYETLIQEPLAAGFSYRIFAISAYENKPDKFNYLQKYIRNENPAFDLILSKQFLDNPELLENLFRNVGGLYFPGESVQKKNVSENSYSTSKNKLPNASPKSFLRAKDFLIRLEKALEDQCPNDEKFEISKQYNAINTSKGKAYRDFPQIIEYVKKNKISINYLLSKSEQNEFQKIKIQLETHLGFFLNSHGITF